MNLKGVFDLSGDISYDPWALPPDPVLQDPTQDFNPFPVSSTNYPDSVPAQAATIPGWNDVGIAPDNQPQVAGPQNGSFRDILTTVSDLFKFGTGVYKDIRSNQIATELDNAKVNQELAKTQAATDILKVQSQAQQDILRQRGNFNIPYAQQPVMAGINTNMLLLGGGVLAAWYFLSKR